ncbi:MAG TPA: FecR domain-containing protein, partial [Nitriliruptorales bacterium]
LTRVDRGSEFRVLALGDAAGVPQVEAELGAGRAWNRVEELGDEASFEVSTAVATAAVRGTAFDVDCAFGCLFRVFEGTVQLTNAAGDSVILDAGQALAVAADGTFGPILALVLLDDDPWLARNLVLDEAAGFPVVILPPAPDAGQAGIGGAWDVRFVSTDESTDPDAPAGSASDVTFTIQPTCEVGPCGGTIDAGQAGTFDIVLVDGVHTIDDTEQTTTAECQPEPVFDRRVTGELLPAAVRADDEAQAAVFVGTVREEFTPLPAAVAAGCAEEGVRLRVSEIRGVLRS